MRLRRAGVVIGVILSIALAPGVRADIITEGVITSRCTEAEDMTIPKRLELTHMVGLNDFETLGRVALVVAGSYEGAGNLKNKGKVLATATLIKPDETEIGLGKVKAKVRRGELEKVKIVSATINQGDRIRWKVRTRAMPGILAEFEECWELELLVGIADEIPD